MIEEVTIENYKSIQSLTLPLGRVTVLIGENGCGKSNILEAIALGSAAAADKLDNEFLAPRGIRVTDPKLMRSAFEIGNLDKKIKVSFKLKIEREEKAVIEEEELIANCYLNHTNELYSSWQHEISEDSNLFNSSEEIVDNMVNKLELELEQTLPDTKLESSKALKAFKKALLTKIKNLREIPNGLEFFTSQKVILSNFLIFCLEFTELRTFSTENQIEPLGIRGQGLFKYLQYLSQPQFKKKLDQIKEKLELIDWFEDFDIPNNLYPGERTLKIKDRYLDPDLEYFDQKSANEGFLFLLFYFCLFIGEETPKFFAIDNIDSSLNPRLCRRLIEELVELAKKHDKQVILTTHNPAVLDGLDLHDDEQKLYVINRKLSGHTKANRIFPLKPLKGRDKPIRLSEAFLRGYIGGLPNNF